MPMRRCPVCGEKYSDTYRDCPFCEEDMALREGDKIRRGGRRSSRGRQFSLITPTLIVLIIILAALLVYLLYGDKIAQKFGKDEAPEKPGTEEIVPVKPAVPDESEDPAEQEDPVEQEDPDASGEELPDGNTPAMNTEEYEAANALPSGLSLSNTDFTLSKTGETHTIRVSGGNGNYTWVSEDAGVASVDKNGTVTAVSRGTVNVIASDGSKKGVCIVRVTATGALTQEPTQAPSSSSGSGSGSSSSASGLKAGAAKVINAGNGVRVRSGPGTNYEILATVSNGADIKIVQHAEGDWYQITFSDVGGVQTTGYMKAEFLENK